MIERFCVAIAALAAIATFAVAVVFGTHAAGGSDSSCYLNAARLLSQGDVFIRQPLAQEAPWRNAISTFTPAGFVPSAVDPNAIVPICPPGLPLVLASFRLVHLSEFLVVPLFGAVTVWLTFVIGRTVDRALTGAAAAMLMSASPTFLYQVVQPMSDVPAAAWWLLAIACVIDGPPEGGRHDVKPEDDDAKPEDDDAKPEHDAGAGARPPVTAQRIGVRSLVAGLAASMALLTRPNLLPLAVVMGCYLLVGTRLFAARRRAVGLAFGLLPGLACLGFLQAATYGSAVATGYGSPSAFMSVANMAPNFLRYGRWLLGAHTPVLMLALAAPLLMRHARHAWLLLAMSATTLACYLPYLVFDDWWYTRFLLPAIPLLVVLSVAVFVDGIERLLARLTWRPDLARLSKVRDVAAFAFLLVLASTWIATSRARHVFELSGLEQHYYRAGRASTRLPDRSVIVTVRNSGSVTYHAGVPILSWDTLEPQALETALRFARTRGLTPYLLLETDEEPVFRDRFASASAIGRLDWPPRVQVGRSIRIYDPMDRSAFFAGANVPTDFVSESAPPARDWRRWLR